MFFEQHPAIKNLIIIVICAAAIGLGYQLIFAPGVRSISGAQIDVFTDAGCTQGFTGDDKFEADASGNAYLNVWAQNTGPQAGSLRIEGGNATGEITINSPTVYLMPHEIKALTVNLQVKPGTPPGTYGGLKYSLIVGGTP